LAPAQGLQLPNRHVDAFDSTSDFYLCIDPWFSAFSSRFGDQIVEASFYQPVEIAENLNALERRQPAVPAGKAGVGCRK
jgi:hypothetical protein